MGKLLPNTYQMDYHRLSAEEIAKAVSGDLEGFRYFFENCIQIQDRDTRQLIHPKMNKGQEMIAEAILRHVALDTRAESHKELVLIGPRQFGKSTLITAISSYIVSYVKGMERSNLVHTLHTGGAAAKYCSQKVIPIITGVHPDLYPTIERESLNTSTQLKYIDLKGRIPRNSIYEVLSASSNSVRSGTVTAWLCDEPSEYRNPEMVEDAISGAISSYGFSFTAYIGTFSDRLSQYFLSKIQLALDHPDDMELIFIPWFLVYGREEDGLGMTEDKFTEYDQSVIVPEMRKYGFSDHDILCKIGWYHQRSLRTSHIRYEFPTCIEDIMSLASDQCYFPRESLDAQEKNIEAGVPYKVVSDVLTGETGIEKTEASPLMVYRLPIYGRAYRIVIDPITAQSTDSDYFAMKVFDTKSHEEMASFKDRGLNDRDYASFAVTLAKVYNNAQLCPESNVSAGFVAEVNSQRYYRWFYTDAREVKKKFADREVGIRTTVATRERMLSKLSAMLERGLITIHDGDTLKQLRNFVKKVRTRADGSSTVRLEAKGKTHDDGVSCLWIYAGSVDAKSLEQHKKSGFSIAW